MPNQIFVNLPVKDLKRTNEFFKALGFEFNAQFSNDDATCMVIHENIFAMLLVEKFFQGFTPKLIAYATKTTEVLLALPYNSRAEVDDLLAKAIAAGGTDTGKVQDLGFMYSRSFSDPNGHIWEIFHMDMSQVPQG